MEKVVPFPIDEERHTQLLVNNGIIKAGELDKYDFCGNDSTPDISGLTPEEIASCQSIIDSLSDDEIASIAKNIINDPGNRTPKYDKDDNVLHIKRH